LKVSNEIKQFTNQTKLFQVDCEKNLQLREEFNIFSYPTLKLFKFGKYLMDFNGERTSENIKKWLESKVLSKTDIFSNQKEVETFVQKNEGFGVIGHFKSLNSDKIEAFKDIHLTDIIFESFPTAILLDANQEEKIELFTKHKNVTFTFEMKNDLKDLKDWITIHGFPLIEEISIHNFQRIAQYRKPIFVAFLDFSKKEEMGKQIKNLEQVSDQIKERFKTTYSNAHESRDQLESLTLNINKLPQFAILNFVDGLNFPYDGTKIDPNSLVLWANSVLDEPVFHTQPEPEKQDGPVYILVGMTFDKIVLDPKKDVFVYYTLGAEFSFQILISRQSQRM
jgi:hypothetical protein